MSDRNPSSCRDRRRRLGTTGLNRVPVPMTSTSLITASISTGAAGSFQALQTPKLPEEKKTIFLRLLTKTLVLHVVQYTAKLQVQDVFKFVEDTPFLPNHHASGQEVEMTEDRSCFEVPRSAAQRPLSKSHSATD